jgi:hypothetical protein
MRKTSRRWIILGLAVLSLISVPSAVWFSLTHQPHFYRKTAALPPERRKREAKRFVAQSLQLRNDICNEDRWEAVFTDEEVNSWLAEDLVTHFADQLPPEVHEPRIAFEADRVTLAFQLDRGPIRSVVWVVARVNVPEGNVLALTLEKIRAGVLPIPAEEITDKITRNARSHGLDIEWMQDGDVPVARIRYTPDPRRNDIVLERLQIRDGQIHLAGRSKKAAGVAARPILPDRRVLQSTFPLRSRNTHSKGVSAAPTLLRRSSISPAT